METKYPQVRVRLAGEDGNAFSIMGRVMNAMKKAGISADEISQYQQESTSGDYDNLLRTAMRWVNCDGFADDNIGTRYTNHDLKTASVRYPELWNDVNAYLPDALLVAWDGCHKMYLAMDEEQAEWFRANYNEYDALTVEGTPHEMLSQLHRWWDESCSLKFISAVETNHDDPNAGYTRLIEQGAEDEMVRDLCECGCGEKYWDCEYDDDTCSNCGESECYGGECYDNDDEED